MIAEPAAESEVVLAARGITKQFPGTLALDRVDFPVYRGKVNVLIGENGAGKSTLVKILAGVEQPTSGVLELDGRPIRMGSARDAAAHGIGIIYQELNLFPNLSVADNIFMAHENARHGVIDRDAQQRVTRELMQRLEQAIDPGTLVGDLPLGQQQIVEIARALAREVRILIMDEPTSALSSSEIAVLFRLIRDLESRGVSIIYISHRLEEVLTIGDRVTVLRDGRVVAGAPAQAVDVAWIVEKMTGRAGNTPAPRGTAAEGRPLLEVRSLSLPGPAGRPALQDISFTLRAGEIVGVYGLMGAGRTELFETLIGLRSAERGSISLDSERLVHSALPDRIRSGLVLVPEDRQRDGLVPTLSVKDNITLARLHGIYLSPAAERARATRMIQELRIRTAGPEQPVTSLSGGNQQKVVISRFLLTSPKVLLLDEPTRGVDVGARAEIFDIIRGLAGQGMGILFASSELQEVLAMSTRILVMSLGRITAEFPAAEATEELLVAASSPTFASADGGEHAHR
jgi:erythritol transport system ATP-binding protein